METSKQELERLYIDEEKGVHAIGEKIGLSHTTVYRRLKEYGIKIRTHREANSITQNTSFVKGEKHPNWAGDKVSYQALHTWVRSRLGTPQKCVKCGTTALHRYEWSNISGEYKRDLSDWERLCPRCHRRKDNGNKPKITIKCKLCQVEFKANPLKKKYELCRRCMKKCWDRGTLKNYLLKN